MKTFDETRLREHLGRLSPKRQVLFAAIISARMAGAYHLYCEKRRLGNERCFQDALFFVWEQLSAEASDLRRANEHLAKVMELVPEEDEHWGPLSAQADDSASVLAYALRCLLEPKPEEAAWAARRAYETVDNLVIQDPNIELGSGNETIILKSPLIQAELERQSSDLLSAETARMNQLDLQDLMARCLDLGAAFFHGAWVTALRVSDSPPLK